MYFDVLFLDCHSYKYYDRNTLEKEPLGGTEATVVRIAEGLASLGLKVAVVQSPSPTHDLKYFPPIIGQHCFFFHSNDIETLQCKHFVQLRSNQNGHLYPESKHYIWIHNPIEPGFDLKLKEDDLVIGVSRWHRNQMRQVMPSIESQITYVYNPVLEDLYNQNDLEANSEYNPNLLIWTSSPHKGLGKALDFLKQIRIQNPKMELLVFNPGYLNLDVVNLSSIPGVHVYGAVSAAQVWRILRKGLCLFYPSTYPETMGLVVAEANALGVPVITFKNGALKEVVSSDQQMIEIQNTETSEDEDQQLITKVLDWSKNGRPKVAGKDEFKFGTVLLEWVKLLAK